MLKNPLSGSAFRLNFFVIPNRGFVQYPVILLPFIKIFTSFVTDFFY